MRRTKIVATRGPASRDASTLRRLLEAGVDVVRLNFAHADPIVHEQTTATVRKVAEELGKVVGILVDLPGPKIRSGPVPGEGMKPEPGMHITLTGEEIPDDAECLSTTLTNLWEMVAPTTGLPCRRRDHSQRRVHTARARALPWGEGRPVAVAQGHDALTAVTATRRLPRLSTL